MSLSDEFECLRKVPMFANVDAARLKLLAFTSDRLVFAPGDVVFRQGEPGDAAYFIVSGSAEILVSNLDGEMSVAAIGENEMVGEIAILCDVPRTATVRAVSELVTLRISKDRFFTVLEEFPEMAVGIMRELARRLESTTVRLREALAAQPAS
jgi:CRP-like cAMP-binding protein